jgi:hypothetical protein
VDEDRPVWARRMRQERLARGWSQHDAVRALRAHAAGTSLTSDENLLRNWKRWEAGRSKPGAFHQPLIARTFGTVTAALFPIAVAPPDTVEIVARLRASDVGDSTVEGLTITVERLCSEYAHRPAEHLLSETRLWLTRLTQTLDRRLTLAQHREILRLAGFLALLVGCVEYDLGRRTHSEATRRAALSLGTESNSGDVVGWAHEMSAWQALTQGDYRGVLAAVEAGQSAAPHSGVAVQLAAQKAKAWARIGDRRQAEIALDLGRALLETLPPPADLGHHFVIDPAKFDFYAMDCYRCLGENRLAATYAREVAPDQRGSCAHAQRGGARDSRRRGGPSR